MSDLKFLPRFETEPAERKFDLRAYVNFVWRHWMLIGAVTAIALIVSVINLVRATPLYTASTQVLLEREKAPGDTSPDRYSYDDGAAIENQLAILRSDSLLRRVVIKERLAVPPPPPSDGPSAQQRRNAKNAEAQLIQGAINWLRGALTVQTKRAGLCARYFDHVDRSG